MPRILTSYFVVMIDHGKLGLEAVVDPAIMRNDVIARIKSGDYDPRKIAYIHHCDFGTLVDVTDELIDEAREDEAPVAPHPQCLAWDRSHDQRKNWERV